MKHRAINIRKGIIIGALYLIAVLFMLPVLLTVLKSVRYKDGFSLQGYYELFFNCFPFYRMFWNSVFYSALITAGTLLISLPAAFAFKFARFRGKNLIFVIYILLMMMPLQVMILPNYIGLRDIGILNTPMAIVLPMWFSPLGVVVLHQYMREIDCTVIEAARLETNSVLRVIIFCILPQIKTCLAAVTLLVFTEMWNMVEQPLLYVNEDKYRNLSAFIARPELYEPGVMLPASVVFLVPSFLCYMLFHEELKKGLKY
ncbi:carbohydrate ABC transporter permease [Anaerocolumna sp. AGMB13020]|uniref:carbohydrate ABC transporter permease n=1 Tax=Anaerocolumna sp. AGMB13020 TaxID=3081750 RepID=UPI0029536B89|nr:carbohydrate ABC transporter permease [Anaerocolumna sp. AGMB13020]WOO36614.1 carbohydrate ABC transporter permease [Anaerocolumna sp. AGMB13020]